MTINLNIVAAILGCLTLLGCRALFRHSGCLGLVLALGGCIVIVAVTLAQVYPAHFSRFAGLCILLGVIALLFYCTGMVSQARRRRGPRYQPPRELRGACSECGRDTLLQRYKQGWLCAKCARRLRAHMA